MFRACVALHARRQTMRGASSQWPVYGWQGIGTQCPLAAWDLTRQRLSAKPVNVMLVQATVQDGVSPEHFHRGVSTLSGVQACSTLAIKSTLSMARRPQAA